MASSATKPLLSPEERVQRRRLILSDSVSLATLFVITALLAILTNWFYKSYTAHQAALSHRWAARGELDLENGKPGAAIDAFRSALADEPGERDIEVSLAEALASAGRIQEATSYFGTLLETEPGNGMINLQLARLAARQNNIDQALEYYHRAIYGNWEGNGYIRRREARMELVNFLIARHLYAEARNELLVGAGNAPENDSGFLLRIAEGMERALDPGDALRIYKSILQHHPDSLDAMKGAGRTAYQLGHFLEARHYLERAVSAPAGKRNPQIVQQSRDVLHSATRLLSLYPSAQLSLSTRGTRLLEDRQIAQDRLTTCMESQAPAPQTTAAPLSVTPTPTPPPSQTESKSGSISGPGPGPGSGTGSGSGTASNPAATTPAKAGGLRNSLENLASRLGGHPAKPLESIAPPAAPPSDQLAALAARWKQEPLKITLSNLENDPDLFQSELQLIYDTEKVTAQVCGPPNGDNALLLKIAEAPNAVEQE